MKKLLLMLLLMISIVSACNSSKLSFSKIENVPDKIQAKIADPTLPLQSVNEKNGSYIIFRSKGEVKGDVTTQGNTVIINFEVTISEDETLHRNVYYLTTDENHDTIDVHVNGKSVPFDMVTI